MYLPMIRRLDGFREGTVFLHVEAYGDGSFFEVGTPLVVIKGPPVMVRERDGSIPPQFRDSVSADAVPTKDDPRVKHPIASRWSVWVRRIEDEDKPKNAFAVGIPSQDGENITSGPTDHSAFFAHSLELENMLRDLPSIESYRIFAGKWSSADEHRRLLRTCIEEELAETEQGEEPEDDTPSDPISMQ